mmetsp:Transcript_2364/g.3607  ORF Transcript_2364/g.3607 Transcript_2364/m.3607 type:complete len:338 (+) Transcript_2364:110-1123(+)
MPSKEEKKKFSSSDRNEAQKKRKRSSTSSKSTTTERNESKKKQSNKEREKKALQNNDTFEGDDGQHSKADNETVDPPVVANGMVEFQLNPVNSHLTCKLCGGYFRDPYTIAECLHTFCKSCLFYAFSSGFRKCPECNIDLGPDPFKTALADRTLQELVDKVLFPRLQETDDRNERKFYEKRGIKLKSEYEKEERIKRAKQKRLLEQDIATAARTMDQQESISSNTAENLPQYSVPLESEDALDLIVVPDDGAEAGYEMPPLTKPLIRVSGRYKIVQLKKYLLKKLQLSVRDPSVIELLCNGGPVGNELSLTFVNRTVWLHGNEELKLTYKFAEDAVY